MLASTRHSTILFGALTWLCVSSFTPDSVVAQVVRGQVIDSVTGNPLRESTVSLVDSLGEEILQVRTDPAGLFLLRPPAPASYRLTITAPGHATSTFPPFDLSADETRSFMLLLPSTDVSEQQARLLLEPCPTAARRGSLVGWVRRAGDRTPIPRATVRVAWTNLPEFLADAVGAGSVLGESRADSTGRYVVCGIPLNTRVWLHAYGDSASSDFVNLVFEEDSAAVGAARLQTFDDVLRLDLQVTPVAQHSSSVVGTVTTAAGGPARGVTVEVAGTEYATQTDSTGRFLLSRLPPGPARLVARRIGNVRVEQEIQIPASERLEIPPDLLVLGSGQELEPVIVEAAPPHDALAEFKHRRETGQGSFITREEFMKQGTPASSVDILRRMQGIRIYPGPDFERRWIIMMQRGGTRTFGNASNFDPMFEGSSPCPPLVFLDRHYLGNVNNFGLDGAIPLETLEAVEAHHSVATMPNEFNRPGANCGVIAFWTRFAEPRAVPVDPPSGERSIWDSTAFHIGLAAAAIMGLLVAVGKAIHF